MQIIIAEGQVPPAAWEALVATGKARAAIRKATRDSVRAQYSGLGQQIVERAFERAGKTFTLEKLKGALPRLARTNVDDVFAAVGRGEMFSGDVVRAVYSDFKDERKAGPAPDVNESGWFGLRKAASLVFKVPNAGGGESPAPIPIRGHDSDLPVHFAPDGGAVPGDRIVGILTPGEGITVYPIQSPALMAFDDQPDRWLDVRWDIEEGRKDYFPSQLRVTVLNEPGTLAEIAATVSDHGGNIDNITMTGRSPDFRDMLLDIEVWDLKHLNAIISQLRAKKVVSKVERVNG